METVTIDDLIVNFKHVDQKEILSDWEWLIGRSRYPVLITRMGDAFVQDDGTGEIFFLDTGYAECRKVADSGEGFGTKLGDKGFVLHYIPASVILHLNETRPLRPRHVYGFKKLPVFGGEHSLENLQQVDLEVHFGFTGQIHQQLQKVPPGTKINSINFELKKQKPWWKFW